MAERTQRRVGRVITLHQHQGERSGAIAEPCHFTRRGKVGFALVNNGHRRIAGIKIDAAGQTADGKGDMGKADINILHG